MSDDPQVAIAERQRLAAQRRERIAKMQTVAETILDQVDLERLTPQEIRFLLPVATRLLEIGLKAERLELGLATDHITNVRPPKPLDQMSLDELRAWRAHLEALNQV
jgi:hypothetical protein